jgi:ABC-type antimicrobial peptide transport system permease subunit
MQKADMLDGFQQRLAHDPRLNQFEADTEKHFYAKQSETMSIFIRVLGIFTTIIFSAGAIIGAMITMYSAVANRTTEIGTLRALGFRRISILYAFLAEALVLSFVGGLAGIAGASLLQFVQISTLNFGSFSEISFSFAMTPDIILISMIFALTMGFIGGFLPAWRASRMDILQALRGG